MQTKEAVRRWYVVHKWTGLVSTLFVLIACITGLPLVFHHEIDHWLGGDVESGRVAEVAAPTLDELLSNAREERPGMHVQLVTNDPGAPEVMYVAMGESVAAPVVEAEILQFDKATGTLLGGDRYDEGFMGFMLRLHIELFAGLPGTLFLGVMSMVFLVALVSGVVLYAPFMRERAFAVIRLDQGPRTRWFDLHNALGIVLLVWIFVVSLTGIINTWGFPLIQYWQIAEMQGLIADDEATAADTGGRLSSLDEAVAAGLEARPGMSLFFAVFPGTELSSPDHYIVFYNGNDPLSSRLFQPVIVNAWSGEMIAAPDMPWYINMLLLSQPLHFGDYGGLGLKIAWALLDVGMIIVLWSGLVLWWRKRAEMPEIDLVPSRVAA